MLHGSILTLWVWVLLSSAPAFAESTLAVAGAANGLYLSRDYGDTWERNVALGNVAVRAVAIDRSDLKRLYAATSKALLLSEDGGTNWVAGEFPEPARIQRLVAGGAGVVLALADGVVWSSSDRGRHWRAEAGIPTGVLSVAVDARDPGTIYAQATSGIYTKSPGGAWLALPGLANALMIAADPDVPGRLITASGWEVARSDDSGATWTKFAAIPPQVAASAGGWGFTGDLDWDAHFAVAALAAGAASNEVIALGSVCITSGGTSFPCSWGVLVSRNGLWRATAPLNGRIEPAILAVDRASNLVLIGGAPEKGGVLRSTVAGDSWTPVRAFDGIVVNAFAIATVDVELWSRVHAGTSEGLFSSSDGGETWQGNAGLGKAEVFAIAVDNGGSGLLLASTSNGLLRSTDAGANWEKSELPPEIQASAIAIDPKPDGRAYLVDRNTRRENLLRLWTSDDRGRSWYQVANQPERVRDVALDSRTKPETVYVAGNFGVWGSTDETLTWSRRSVEWPMWLVRAGEPAATLHRAGIGGLAKSANGGASWSSLSPPTSILGPPPGAEPVFMLDNAGHPFWYDALAVGSGRSGMLLAGCLNVLFFGFLDDLQADALFTVDDEGWHALEVSPGTCKTVAVDPRAAGLVYAGGAGLRRSRDGGRNWEPVPGFGNSVAVHSLAVASRYFLPPL